MSEASKRAMIAAVSMEIHAACSTTTLGKAIELDGHFSGYDDLLEALKTMDAFWTDEFPEGPDGDPKVFGGRLSDDTLGVWRVMRAAIAKAEGGAA